MGRPAARLAARTIVLTLALALIALVVTIGAVALALSIRFSLVAIFGCLALLLTLPGWRALEALTERARDGAPGSPVDEAALGALVADVAAALGLKAPEAIHLTLGPDVEVVRFRGRRKLVASLPCMYGVPEGAARAALAHALLRDSSALSRLHDGRITATLLRALAYSGLPVVGAPWRRVVSRLLADGARARRLRTLEHDRECVRLYGAPAVAEHVRVTNRARAFGSYWTGEVVPCLETGFHPPVFAGWQRFLRDPEVAERVNERLTATSVGHPRDDEPPAGQRLTAIAAGGSPESRAVVPSVPMRALERVALRAVDAGAARELVEIEWEQVISAVWLPSLRRTAAGLTAELEDATVADLEALSRSAAGDELGAALAVALADAGWALVLEPGGALLAERDGFTLYPLFVPRNLAADGDGDGWRRFVEDSGIAAVALAPPPEPRALSEIPTATSAAVLLLERTRTRRRSAIALAVLLSPMVLLMGFAGVVMFVEGEPTAAVRASGGLFSACALGLGWFLLAQLRTALSRTSVTIDDEGVRIEDRRLLRRTFVIPRERVRVAAVDDGDERSLAGRPLKFPCGGTTWSGAEGWLWHGPDRRSFATVGLGDEVPNVLLLFDTPVAAPRLRRRRAESLPRRNELLGGLVLNVHDPDLARHVLSGWDVLRPLSVADAEAAPPRCRAA